MALQRSADVDQMLRMIMQEGVYTSETEVMVEALQLLQQRDRLRAEIQIGLDELDRGERMDGETVFAELRARAEEIEKSAQ